VNVDDLTVEVRDPDLKRVGQLVDVDLVGAEFVLRHNEVGTWRVNIHASSPIADTLRTPGYGLIVTGPNGVIMSGPTVSTSLAQTDQDPDGTWTITGYDDSIILADRLAYPTPATADVTAQTDAYDVRDDVAETVIKGYVDANLVSGPAVRQVSNLTVATDEGRGAEVYGRARFDTLQELFNGLAQTGGLGYSIVQDGASLVFDVYEPQDRSGLVRLDIDNGRLSSADYQYEAPLVTRAIVAGAGEKEERLFFEGTLTQSTDAESLWGRRIERLVDARSTQEVDEFEQESAEALIDDGKTRVALTVTPTDNVTMLYGDDWGLGDTITVTVGSTIATAVVYTVALSVQTDGVYLAAEVGKPQPVALEGRLLRASERTASRVGEIERNTTGYGVVTPFPGVQGGTDGTQPTFSGEVFTATYTRFGDMIHFAYSVDFTNITSFGTGQYFMTLPYNARRDYAFRDGRLMDDDTGRRYHITGTVSQGSNVMELWTTDISGQRLYDFAFTNSEPVTLTTSDSFSIAGTYELEQ
jgi:hypothetical protein